MSVYDGLANEAVTLISSLIIKGGEKFADNLSDKTNNALFNYQKKI